MSEKNWNNIITASFMLLCFITFTFIVWLYFGGKEVVDDSCYCKFIISGIVSCIVFIVVFALCNWLCKPKFKYFSEKSGVGITQNCKISKYSDLEFFCFVDDLQKLEKGMFLGCKKLIMVKLPSKLKEIPIYTFAGCGKLSDASIPDTIKTIGEYAFLGCSSLSSVIIPENTNEIEKYAFANCRAVSKLTINSMNVQVDETAFKGCNSIKEIITSEESLNVFYSKHKNWLAELPDECVVKENENSSGKKLSELKNGTNQNNPQE